MLISSQSNVDSLIIEHAPLVRKIAYRMASRLPSNIEVDDLIQAGMMGLMEAARRYKEQVGAQFSTYATTCIKGAMQDELRRADWMPRSTRDAAKKIEAAIVELSGGKAMPPTEREIADHLGLGLQEYTKLLDKAQGVQIVFMGDEREDDSDGAGYQQRVESLVSDVDGPDGILEQAEFQALLVQLIQDLPERERLVLSLHYEQDLNYKEIALVLEVSQGRACQLRTQAITRIRSGLQSHGFL